MTAKPKGKIVKDQRVCGGAARLEGTRVRVMDIVEMRESLGYSPRQIADAFRLTSAQVNAALSYYRTHRPEIRTEIGQHDEVVKKYAERLPVSR